MTDERGRIHLRRLFGRPDVLVRRLVVAEVLAPRGAGPLARPSCALAPAGRPDRSQAGGEPQAGGEHRQRDGGQLSAAHRVGPEDRGDTLCWRR